MSSKAFDSIASDARLARTAALVQQVLKRVGADAFVTTGNLSVSTGCDVNQVRLVMQALVQDGVAVPAAQCECRCGAPLDEDDDLSQCIACGENLRVTPPLRTEGYVLRGQDQRLHAPRDRASRARYAVITALPHEAVAVRLMLDQTAELALPGERRSRTVVVGSVPAAGGTHEIILANLPDMGTNQGAAATAWLGHEFPELRAALMVGIAAGMPNVHKPDEHVRLGDVVVVSRDGVVQFDNVTDLEGELKPRHPPRPPSAELLDAARLLEQEELLGTRDWLQNLSRIPAPGATRPGPDRDVLRDGDTVIEHPDDPARRPGEPRVFHGSIASGNTLLRNADRRTYVRDKYGVRALEMESSGVADAAWVEAMEYFVIRGICDYGDRHKNDEWHRTASSVAAAYLRGLLGKIAP